MPKARKPPSTPTVLDSTAVFVVNRAGAVHDIDPATQTDVLKRPGYRLATEGEIAAYHATPVQEASDPIGKRGL
jgi:hypothetical protein